MRNELKPELTPEEKLAAIKERRKAYYNKHKHDSALYKATRIRVNKDGQLDKRYI